MFLIMFDLPTLGGPQSTARKGCVKLAADLPGYHFSWNCLSLFLKIVSCCGNLSRFLFLPCSLLSFSSFSCQNNTNHKKFSLSFMYALEKDIHERLQKLEAKVQESQSPISKTDSTPSPLPTDSAASSDMPQPQLWFNARTNRWISTSCRTYRELLRDKKQSEHPETHAENPKKTHLRASPLRRRSAAARHRRERSASSSSRSPSPRPRRKKKRQGVAEDSGGRSESLFSRYGF